MFSQLLLLRFNFVHLMKAEFFFHFLKAETWLLGGLRFVAVHSLYDIKIIRGFLVNFSHHLKQTKHASCLLTYYIIEILGIRSRGSKIILHLLLN